MPFVCKFCGLELRTQHSIDSMAICLAQDPRDNNNQALIGKWLSHGSSYATLERAYRETLTVLGEHRRDVC